VFVSVAIKYSILVANMARYVMIAQILIGIN